MSAVRHALAEQIVRFFVYVTSKLYRVVIAYAISRVLAVFVFTGVEDWRVIDAYWWGEVASLTIGYGDLSPETTLGRLLATPFHFFWVYYCGLTIGAHIVFAVFKSKNEWTHAEQEWTFNVLSVIFGWVRWLVQVQLDNPAGRTLPAVPNQQPDGSLMDCPQQASDTDDGDLVPEPAPSR